MAGSSLALAELANIISQLLAEIDGAKSSLNAATANETEIVAQAIAPLDSERNDLVDAATNAGLATTATIIRTAEEKQRLDVDTASQQAAREAQSLSPRFIKWKAVYDDNIDKFKNEFIQFMNTYFPPINTDISGVLAWAEDAQGYRFSPDSTGITRAWDQHRSRILLDTARAQDEALVTWAARGYALPPGAAAGQRSDLDQDARDKIANASRDEAINATKIAIDAEGMSIEHQRQATELILKAQESAARSRQIAMQAASEYIKLFAFGPTYASQVADAEPNAQDRMIGAVLTYFKDMAVVEDMPNRIRTGNVERTAAKEAELRRLTLQKLSEHLEAARAQMQIIGNFGSTAINALHAQVAVSGSERMIDLNL
jgi:hypothetical protein